MDPMDACDGYIEFDVGVGFPCQLQEGHVGDHQNVYPEARVYWPQTSPTVTGEVV